MAYDPKKVIDIALKEVGYLEKKNGDSKYLNDKTKNAGMANYTKYGKEMHELYPKTMDYPAAWCDCFVDWCFYKAYGYNNAMKIIGGNFDDYTVNSAGLYKNKKAWHTMNPKVGDQIFFKNSAGKICHTGLVYAVDSKYVYTVEGNTSNSSGVVANGGCVAKKKYDINYSRIAGYGRPLYGTTSSGSTLTTSSATGVVLPTGELSYGSKGIKVKNLQMTLNYLNKKYSLFKDTLDTDGIYGDKTMKAVKAVQKYNNLEPDGVYGSKTMNAMYKM